ncbi:MAG TPA: hypothetical protein VMR73_00900 [Candidatus Paceibacterota bacterium]|nr:hypothetical protein [Candidatus Paceibacterota bacterium]
MKRIISHLLLTTTIIATFAVPIFAFAQVSGGTITTNTSGTSAPPPTLTGPGFSQAATAPVSAAPVAGTNTTAPLNVSTPAGAAANSTTGVPNNDSADTCSWFTTSFGGSCFNPLTYVPKILDAAFELFFLPVAGWMLALSGYMLDYMINYSLNFATQVGTAGSAIVLGWTIIRDMFNIAFIFALIYISITTMLDYGNFQAKQALRNIIIGALLINFSFFFTEVMIDAGNILGGWLYQGIETTLGQANGGAGATSILSATPTGLSISAGLTGALGVYDVYNSQSAEGLVTGNLNDATARLIGAVIRLALIIFATYIFAYVSVLFLARTISLMFSLVLSPLGFAGWILPQTANASKKWWEEFQKDVLIAPVFLLLLYIILAFVNSPIFAPTSSIPSPSAGTANAFDPTQYFKYFLLAGMLIFTLRKTKEYSGEIGDMLGKVAEQLSQVVAGVGVAVVAGGTAAVLRNSVGAMGAGLAQKAQQTLIDPNASAAAKSFARIQRFAGGKVGGASFDLRQTGVLQNAGFTGKGFGLDLGKPSKDSGRDKGYFGVQKARIENEKKYAEDYKPSDEDINKMNGMKDAAGNTATQRILGKDSEYKNAKASEEKEKKKFEDMQKELIRMASLGEGSRADRETYKLEVDKQEKVAQKAETEAGKIESRLKQNISPRKIFGEEKTILDELTKSNDPTAANYKAAFMKARGRELYAETTAKVGTILRDEEILTAPLNIAATAAVRMTTNNLARVGSAIAKISKGNIAGAAKEIAGIVASPVTEVIGAKRELETRYGKALKKMSDKQWEEIKPQKISKNELKKLQEALGFKEEAATTEEKEGGDEEEK